jgi:hypothetical protein
MKSTYDQSLFVWNFPHPSHPKKHPLKDRAIGTGILTTHPHHFSCADKVFRHWSKAQPCMMTNRGVQICMRILNR